MTQVAQPPSGPPSTYFAEPFTNDERAVLSRYVTSVDGPVFALSGLPQVTAAALFARYSRSAKSLRRLLLDEFLVGVAASGLSVALTSYLVALAVFIPASGWLADQFGSRTIFCAAMAVFMTGSIGCAQSDSLPMLVLARFVQGMGGAMMVPVGRLVLLRSVPRENLVLFQINFGLSAATSGTMMMVSAVGALADSLGLEVEECAAGIVRVANVEMLRALRVMTVEQGIDPRGFALLAFGGAGGLHACEMADELEIMRWTARWWWVALIVTWLVIAGLSVWHWMSPAPDPFPIFKTGGESYLMLPDGTEPMICQGEQPFLCLKLPNGS